MKVIPLFSDEDADLRLLGWQMRPQPKFRNYPARLIRPAGSPTRKMQFAHIVVLERMLGRKRLKGELCDHINRDTLDCRRENLRVASYTGNSQNKTLSQFRGTTLHKETGKWVARVYHTGRVNYIGLFIDRKEAAAAAKAKRIELGFLGETV